MHINESIDSFFLVIQSIKQLKIIKKNVHNAGNQIQNHTLLFLLNFVVQNHFSIIQEKSILR